MLVEEHESVRRFTISHFCHFFCLCSILPLESSCGLLLPIGHVCHYMKRMDHLIHGLLKRIFAVLRVGSFNCFTRLHYPPGPFLLQLTTVSCDS